jgi:6-phosphogluconolactonase
MEVVRRVLADAARLARAAAEEFALRARAAVEARGSFHAALSGADPCHDLYRLLGKDPWFRNTVPWERAHFYMADERSVAPDDPESHYRRAYFEMFRVMPVRAGHVWRFWSEDKGPEAVASYYEGMLREALGLRAGEWPRFDLVVLGLGADGHTAGLFPGSPALEERLRWALAPWVEPLSSHVFTLTPPVMSKAAAVMFLVSGEDRAEALRDAVDVESPPERSPARVVQPGEGITLWLADRAAARLLGSAPPA